MNKLQAFNKEEEAVSPVIGVILMVAITVVLAAVVFVLVSNLGDSGDAAPSLALRAEGDSANDDILIKHVTGQALPASEYEVSVVPRGSSPTYIACTGALEAGAFIIVDQESSSLAAACDGVTLADAAGTDIAAGEYHVLVRHIPSSSTLLDVFVEVF